MEDETNTENTSKVKLSKKKKYLLITIVVGIVLGGGYYMTSGKEEVDTITSKTPETVLEDAPVENNTGPVARVNGEEVSRVAYENSIKELTTLTSRQGYNTASPSVSAQVRQQALAALINTRLLVQRAIQAGVTATAQETAEQYKIIEEEAGGQEILIEVLKDLNTTDLDLRKSISEQIIVEKYLQQETDYLAITLTEEEVQAYYDNIKASNENTLPFIDVADELRPQLLIQKQQQHVSTFIQSLRDTAEIEVLI